MSETSAEKLHLAQDLLRRFKLPEALCEAELALALLEEKPDRNLRAAAHEAAGLAAHGVGRYPLATEHLQQAILILDELNEQQQLLSCQLALAETLIRQGELGAARNLARLALDTAQAEQWDEIHAKALLCLGNLAMVEGRRAESKELAEAALAEFIALDKPAGASYARSALAIVYTMAGDDERAAHLLHEALASFQTQKDYSRVARCLNNLGGIAHNRGDYSRAREYLLQCVDLETEIHARGDMSSAWFNLGLIELETGNTKLARKYLHRALQISQESGDRSSQGAALLHLGVTAFEEGDYQEALNLGELALSSYEGSSSDRGRMVETYIPIMTLAAGHIARAEALWAVRPPLMDVVEQKTLTGMLDRFEIQLGNSEPLEKVFELIKKWRTDLQNESL